MRRTVLASGLALAAWLAAPGVAGELESLIQEYTAAKPKTRGGDTNQRRERVNGALRPILNRIAKLDTPEAAGFLRSEFEKEGPEISAACVGPLLSTSGDKVLEAILGNFAKRPRQVKEEILRQLAETKRDLQPAEGALIGLLRAETQPEVRKEFPPLLAKLGTAAAAKALMASMGGPPPARGKERSAEEYDRAVAAALKGMTSDAVKEWLAGEAFAGASPARLVLIAEMVGELKLEAARPQLEKHIEGGEDRVAVRCLQALIQIGSGPSAAKIGEALRHGKRSLAFRIQALDALAATGTDDNLAVVKDAARDSDPDTRSVALGSLAKAPGANLGACEAILAGLKDSDAGVRFAALRALKTIRHRAMVPALIEFLAAEKEDKLKIDTVQFLVQITGKNMGLVVEDWRKWWDIAEQKFEFPKEAAQQVTAAKSYDLKYFGIEVSSKRIGFLLDASGSMTEMVDVYARSEKDEKKEPAPGGTRAAGGSTTAAEPPGGEKGKEGEKDADKEKEKEKRNGPKTKARKIDVLKKELARVVGELPKDTQINIITFAASYKPWQDTLQPLAGGGREKALAFVREIGTSSGTNVFDTIEFALRDKRVDTLFLLTDGLPTAGKFRDAPSILREVRTLNRVRGVVINCVAFGEESDLLKQLAQENGGVYRFVNSY